MANPYYDLIPQLDAQKAQGKQGIDASQAAALAALTKIQGDWGAQQPGYQQAVGSAYDQALQAVQGQADKIAADLGFQGVTNQAPVQGQLSFAKNVLAQSKANQDALGQRIAQVFSGQLADRQAGANQIGEGGVSNLESNYQQALAQLQTKGADYDAQLAAAAARSSQNGNDTNVDPRAYLIDPNDYPQALVSSLNPYQANKFKGVNLAKIKPDLSNVSAVLAAANITGKTAANINKKAEKLRTDAREYTQSAYVRYLGKA